MKTKAQNLIAGGLFLATLTGATSALAGETAAPIWRAHLHSDYLQPFTPKAVPISAATSSATLWRAYLPNGRVGSPDVSAYAKQQIRSRIPWSSQVSANSNDRQHTVAGIVR